MNSTQEPSLVMLDIDSIIVGDRVRRDMGDIDGLAASIKQQSLLHPIVVKRDYIISHARSTASTFKWPLPRAAAEMIVGIYNTGRRANPLPPLKTRVQGKGKKKSVS